jgi:hypothetical protein
MKKLLLILSIALVGCSSESIQEENPTLEIQYQYFMELEAECLSGNGTTYEIAERIYKSLYTLEEINDCDSYHTYIPDINGNEREGYLSDLETEDPTYNP